MTCGQIRFAVFFKNISTRKEPVVLPIWIGNKAWESRYESKFIIGFMADEIPDPVSDFSAYKTRTIIWRYQVFDHIPNQDEIKNTKEHILKELIQLGFKSWC